MTSITFILTEYLEPIARFHPERPTLAGCPTPVPDFVAGADRAKYQDQRKVPVGGQWSAVLGLFSPPGAA